MLGEILAVTVIGGGLVTVLDHENVFGNNPTKVFWWERVFPKPPAPGPTATQLAMMQQAARQAAEQERRLHPPSKYVVTGVSQPVPKQPYIRPPPVPY